MNQPDPVTPGARAMSAYDIDALRLLRLTHLRRLLRTLCAMELFALPLWAAYSLIMEAIYDRSSEQFWRIDAETGPGFLVILIAFGVTGLLLLGSRWLGPAGRAATRFVPMIGKAAVPRVPDGVEPGRAVVARLRRHPFFRSWLLGVVLFSAVLTVVGASGGWPAWQANHGRGGQVVTMGKQASIAYSERVVPLRHRPYRQYFLGTPRGTAVAETYGKPSHGEQWTVTRDVLGNLRAYRVGGHDYLTMLLILAIGLLFFVAGVGTQFEVIRRERRRRRSAGAPDLAVDVAGLAGGERPELLAGKTEIGVLGLKPHAGRAPSSLLLRRRLTSGTTGVLVAGGLVALLVVQQVGLLTAPPDHRDVHLPYIAAADWDPEATAYYTHLDHVKRSLRRYADAPDADEVSAVRRITVEHETPPGNVPISASADVTLARIGSMDQHDLVSGWREHSQRASSGSEIADLPAGWAGHSRQRSTERGSTTIMGVDDGLYVEIEVQGHYMDTTDETAQHLRSKLISQARSLASAFRKAGLHRVDQDTARPDHL